jgi:hypothetical protein
VLAEHFFLSAPSGEQPDAVDPAAFWILDGEAFSHLFALRLQRP